MNKIIGFVVALLLTQAAGFGLMGCNTFRGAGKDIQRGGEAIEDAADNVQEKQSYNGVRQHTIVASAAPGGSISPSGNLAASSGSNQYYTVTPARGYHVADVLVDGKSIGAVSRHTFSDVSEGHTISALFTVNPKL